MVTALRFPLGRLLLIGPSALGLLVLVILFSMAEATEISAPNISARLQSRNATALAQLAKREIGERHDAIGLRTATDLARRSLMRDPTQAGAMTVLGLAADVLGDHAKARLIMNRAALLSRRELSTRIWLIEDAAARGDVRGALDQYDIALSTSLEARDLLFPILGSSLSEKEILAALIEVFRHRPNWEHAFIGHVIAEGSAVEQLVPIFTALPSDPLMQAPDMRQALLDQLVAQRRYALADRFYTSLRLQPLTLPRNRTFSAINGLAPFDWQFGDSGIAMTVRESGRSMLRFSTSSAHAEPISSQLMTLPSGRYHFSGSGSYSALPQSGGVLWQIRCTPPAGTILTSAQMPVGQGDRAIGASFAVPRDCPAQWLELLLKNPDDVSIEGQVDWVRINAIE